MFLITCKTLLFIYLKVGIAGVLVLFVTQKKTTNTEEKEHPLTKMVLVLFFKKQNKKQKTDGHRKK